ncbi:hypothetical protein UK23_40800 [Lentzea aerocolonigenes]|uniref:Ig-like domain-containing protein n=1 Tax=Lentzea aerocolonigenes TaxID=68170 RepID=A0A0F0GK04_LENAE|nr:hypothetical protein [Lentzea aerocolonigenes]KJK39467.1 hypothetical protein UK23_40800 [Lentzea aerocolonigenes]
MLRKTLSLAAAVAMLALAAPTASAATSVSFTPQSVLGPGVPRDGSRTDQNVVALGTVTLDLTATQSAQVVSVMRVNSATVRTLFDNEIVCSWAGGGKNAVLGQNVYQKGSGSPQWEDLTLTTSQLVHPGVAARVTCTAYVRTASLGWDDSTVNLVSGSLRIAPTAGRAIQAAVPVTVPLDAQNPITRQPAIPMFDVPARTLDVVADTEYMVCNTSTPCDKTKTSKAAFTLIVNQWKADGTLCQTDSAAVTADTPYWVHHVVVPLKLTGFPVKTDNGCIPRFNAYVLVKWLSGQTGAVQGVAANLTDARGSTGRHNSDMSAIYVVPR